MSEFETGYYPDPITSGEYDRWWSVRGGWMDETRPSGGPPVTGLNQGTPPNWRESGFEAEVDFVAGPVDSSDSTRDRWQYTVVNLGSFFAGDRLVRHLGQLGADGWELVTIYDKSSNWIKGFEKGFALFKRPVPSGTSPAGEWARQLHSL